MVNNFIELNTPLEKLLNPLGGFDAWPHVQVFTSLAAEKVPLLATS
jgi:hypothetical protein